MELRKRKRFCLKDDDYASHGAYFVTICTDQRRPIFWTSSNPHVGANCVRPSALPLSSIGRLVDAEIQRMNTIYPSVFVDKYVIMPNHIHMIVVIDRGGPGRTQFAPTLSRILKQFKGSVTKQVGAPIWQKSFYDHVIRNEAEYLDTWAYIDENPAKWTEDDLFCPTP